VNSHWPILVALILIVSAGVYGFVVQTENEQRGKAPFDIRQLPTKYVSAPPAATTNTVYQIKTFAQEQAAPVATLNRLIPGAKTAVVPGAPGVGIVAVDRDAIFTSLRATVEQRYGVPASQTATGFSLAVPGVRMDVDGVAWSIALYNDNKPQPTVQSDGFVAMMNLLAATLEIDMNTTATPLGDGKVSRRPSSKLGRLSMMTDPKMNNSVTIKPLVKKPTTPIVPGAPGMNVNPNITRNGAVLPTPPNVPGAGAPTRPQVVQPARPLPAPVAPVKPPANDQF